MAKRNLHWTADELMLALDFYFVVEFNKATLEVEDQRVTELSDLLKQLPIFPETKKPENHRSPASVLFKLLNFARLDPNFPGKPFPAGSKLDIVVWDEYSDNRERLVEVAAAIRENKNSISNIDLERLQEEEEGQPEGGILMASHLRRDRSTSLSRKKKKQVLDQTGKLACEICKFDFFDYYGQLGKGFAECHHLIPLSKIRPGTKTKLMDLAILCANCHRMIHKTKPMMSIDEFRAFLRSQGRIGHP